MKENQSVKPVIDMDAQAIIFEVRNHTPLRFDMTKLHPDNLKRAAYVGMAQVRIVDAAAVGQADSAGKIIPAAERDAMKYNRMKALIEHYESGTAEWNRKGAGGFDDSALVIKAVARVRKISETESLNLLTKFADAKFEGDLKATLKHCKGDAKFTKAMLEIRSESIVSVVDVDTALDELATAPE